MEKLAEDIWKGTWLSLLTVVTIVGFVRYFNQEQWWRVEDSKPEEYVNSPIVYYSIMGGEKLEQADAVLFVKNIPQEESLGEYGVFENIIPGQIMSVQVRNGSGSVRSPAFRLQDGEIRLLKFKRQGDELVYLGSHSRARKIFVPALEALDQKQEENLFQLDVLKEIENDKPFKEAVAKEEDKVIDNTQENNNDNSSKDFPKNKYFMAMLPQYSQSSPEHRSICE